MITVNNPLNKSVNKSRKSMIIPATAALLLLLIAIAIPAYAIVMVPTTSTNQKSVPACQRADADKNPFCKGYKTTYSGKGGWKVAVGKIDLGTPTKPTNKYGNEQVLKGLEGFVTPKAEKSMTLSQKADLKMTAKKAPAKYMNLVDFVKGKDAETKGQRR